MTHTVKKAVKFQTLGMINCNPKKILVQNSDWSKEDTISTIRIKKKIIKNTVCKLKIFKINIRVLTRMSLLTYVLPEPGKPRIMTTT